MYQGFTYAESAIENPAEITSSQIESLNAPTASTVGAVKKVINEKAYNQTKITSATASRPWRQYFLAIPADYGWVMSSAKDANNIDCTIRKANDVTFVFEETEVVYNVYYINNAADYGTLTINWTL